MIGCFAYIYICFIWRHCTCFGQEKYLQITNIVLIQNSDKTKSDGSISVPGAAELFCVCVTKYKLKTYLVKRVAALKLELISKMISIRCKSALAAWCCFFLLNALLHTLYTAVTTSNIIASST